MQYTTCEVRIPISDASSSSPLRPEGSERQACVACFEVTLPTRPDVAGAALGKAACSKKKALQAAHGSFLTLRP